MLKFKNANYNFYRIFFSIILSFSVLAASFFVSGTKRIFADSNSKILICIDPGHGGKDHGTIGPTGLSEKDVNLDIAIKLRDKLIGYGFKVILTREDDTNHSLDEIVNFANTNNADIFIGVHNNGHISREKSGTEAFYFSQSPKGKVLANFINSRTIEQIGTVNRGVKTASFVVLKNTKMVAALIEGAFISNPDEEAKLKDSNFRDKIATGIFNGVVEYLKTYKNITLNTKSVASAQSFVRRVFQRSLNIDPDQTALNSWADKLASGTITHADVVRGIILSKQFDKRDLADFQYIDVLYGAVLDRSPDSNGAAYWLDRLKLMDRKSVLEHFLESAEFKGLVNHYIKDGYNYAGATFTLSVLNGAGVKGIAAKTSGLLKEITYSDGKDKYSILNVYDADNYNYKNTQIICKHKDPEILKAAEEIKTALKVGIITTQDGNSADPDMVIIIGKDYSSGASSANAANAGGEDTGLLLINILNGAGAPGIAAELKSRIEVNLNNEMNIVEITETKNADNFGYENTKIIIFTTKPGISDIAQDLKKLLGAVAISKSGNNIDNVDITIILGSDYKN